MEWPGSTIQYDGEQNIRGKICARDSGTMGSLARATQGKKENPPLNLNGGFLINYLPNLIQKPILIEIPTFLHHLT